MIFILDFRGELMISSKLKKANNTNKGPERNNSKIQNLLIFSTALENIAK